MLAEERLVHVLYRSHVRVEDRIAVLSHLDGISAKVSRRPEMARPTRHLFTDGFNPCFVNVGDIVRADSDNARDEFSRSKDLVVLCRNCAIQNVAVEVDGCYRTLDGLHLVTGSVCVWRLLARLLELLLVRQRQHRQEVPLGLHVWLIRSESIGYASTTGGSEANSFCD
jgi:hypothetical protein